MGDLSLSLDDLFANSLPETNTERTDIEYFIKGRLSSPFLLPGSYFVLFSQRL